MYAYKMFKAEHDPADCYRESRDVSFPFLSVQHQLDIATSGRLYSRQLPSTEVNRDLPHLVSLYAKIIPSPDSLLAIPRCMPDS